MSRSSWKLPYIMPRLGTRRFSARKVLSTLKRNSLISNICIDKTFKIYNGWYFAPIKIKQAHVNLRLGQLSSTTLSVT